VITQTEKEIYHGHAGVREWYPAAFEVFPDWTPKAVEVRDFGDAVLVTSDVTGTGAASGVHYTERFWLAVTLRDGKISWFGFHRSEEEALAALEERGRR
jgi:ketosteroid isomerase-like protein